MDIIAITNHDDVDLAGYTTEDSRSSYGQPVFRVGELPGVGDTITVHYSDGNQSDAVVIGLDVDDSDTGWIMIAHAEGTTAAINTVYGRESALVTDTGDEAYPPADSDATHSEWISKMLEEDKLVAKDAIKVGSGLGGYLF